MTKGYIDAALIGMVLTYWIKGLGYEARSHMDGNYLMVMPLAAKVDGTARWLPVIQEKCFGKWQEFGSDCGLCVARCPIGLGGAHRNDSDAV